MEQRDLEKKNSQKGRIAFTKNDLKKLIIYAAGGPNFA